MSTDNMPEDELDDLFRQSASAYEPEFDPAAWQAMEQKLDAYQHGKTFWKRIGWSTTLLLLLGLAGWFGFYQFNNQESGINTPITQAPVSDIPATEANPKSTNENLTGAAKKSIKAAPQPLTESGIEAKEVKNKLVQDKYIAQPRTVVPAKSTTPLLETGGKKKSTALLAHTKKSNKQNNLKALHNSEDRNSEAKSTKTQPESSPEPGSILATNTETKTETNSPTYAGTKPVALPENIADTNIAAPANLDTEGEKKTAPNLTLPGNGGNKLPGNQQDTTDTSPKNSILAFNRFALTVMVAPDLSTVGFANPGGVSTNAGVAISYFITNKWSLTTGLIRANKIYTAKPEDYKATPGFWNSYYEMENIDAACEVLDIPVNVGYNVWQKKKSTVTLRTGLSSYLMRSERYEYQYLYYGKPTTKTWSPSNRNNHFFSIYNLSAAYTRQLTNSLAISAEPFAKVPLAGVGAGKVKLASAGLFLSLNYRYPQKL